MDTFIVTMTAKQGCDDKVADFYTKQAAQYQSAEGFISRRVLMSRPGTMAGIVRRHLSEEEMARHPEADHGDKGAHFVIIEQWDSAEARMQWSLNRDKSLDRELFQYLDPHHTHEFYDELVAE